jgi:Ca2+-binding EF-hand superfamily protein
VWSFETAPDASFHASIEDLQKFNISGLLKDIARFISEKSSVEAVRNVLSAIDEKKTKLLDAEDFRWGLIDLGYNLNKNEAEQVVAYFDKSGSGVFNYEDILS